MPKVIGDLKLYCVKELSEMLSLTPLTLRTYIHQGKLKGRKAGTTYYVTEEALREFFEMRQTKKKKSEKKKI